VGGEVDADPDAEVVDEDGAESEEEERRLSGSDCDR